MEVKALRIRQDAQTIYVTTIPAGQLIRLSEPDVFRIEDGMEHGTRGLRNELAPCR